VVRRIIESFGIVPGDNFADNYRQLVALRGGRRGVAWRRVECFSLCCFFKRILASRDTEELHVE
jgi:hypothetical protein